MGQLACRADRGSDGSETIALAMGCIKRIRTVRNAKRRG